MGAREGRGKQPTNVSDLFVSNVAFKETVKDVFLCSGVAPFCLAIAHKYTLHILRTQQSQPRCWSLGNKALLTYSQRFILSLLELATQVGSASLLT